MESYRSGHNGAVLKTVRAKVHRGSNPLLSAMKRNTFCQLDKRCFFSSKSVLMDGINPPKVDEITL